MALQVAQQRQGLRRAALVEGPRPCLRGDGPSGRLRVRPAGGELLPGPLHLGGVPACGPSCEPGLPGRLGGEGGAWVARHERLVQAHGLVVPPGGERGPGRVQPGAVQGLFDGGPSGVGGELLEVSLQPGDGVGVASGVEVEPGADPGGARRHRGRVRAGGRLRGQEPGQERHGGIQAAGAGQGPRLGLLGLRRLGRLRVPAQELVAEVEAPLDVERGPEPGAQPAGGGVVGEGGEQRQPLGGAQQAAEEAPVVGGVLAGQRGGEDRGGAAAVVDGEPVDVSLPVELAAGTHLVRGAAPGHHAWTQKIEVPAGETVEVVPQLHPVDTGPGPVTLGALGAGGVGAVTGITAVVFGLMARTQFNEIDDRIQGGGAYASRAEADEIDGNQTLANVLGATAVVALLAGGGLYFFEPEVEALLGLSPAP